MRVGALLLLTALLSQPYAAVVERTSVAGSIKGYFMSPEGALSVHEFPVGGPSEVVDAPSLHPLWSQYYLTVTVTSPAALSHIRLVAEEDGAVLYDHPFDPPVHEVHLPPGMAAGLGVHARHGLSWRLELTEEGGRTQALKVAVSGVHLLPMPPLKVNWLDLLRIGQVRSLLKACGDAILPGLRADDVPFLLLGDEGQGVMVDHPEADGHGRRYIGPSPLEARLYVGEASSSFPRGVGFSAAALRIIGHHTVALPYDDAWWAQPDAARVTGNDPDAWERLGDLAHEACHIAWGRKCGDTSVGASAESLLRVPPFEARALAEAERQVLADALDAPEGQRPRLVREFLALREERSAADEPTAELISALEPQETDEGLAWHVSWRLPEAAREAGLSADGRPIGPVGAWYTGQEPSACVKEWLTGTDVALTWHPLATVLVGSTIYGATGAFVLHALHPEALTRIWSEGRGNLREALAAASGYYDLSPGARAELRRAVRVARGCDERAESIRSEATQKGRKLRRELRETGSGDTVALSAEVLIYGEPERTFRSADEGPWEYLERLGMPLPDGQLYVDRPCLVRVNVGDGSGTAEVRAVLGDTSTLLRLTQRADLLAIVTKEVVLQARSQSLRPRKGALVARPVGARVGESRRESADEGDGQSRRPGAVPLGLMVPGPPGACQSVECPDVTATISGLFLRTDTSATEQKVFGLLDLPTQEIWYTIPGEWYALSATLSDTLEPSVSRATLVAPDDTVIADESADPAVYSLTAQGQWQSPAQSDGFAVSARRLLVVVADGVTGGTPQPHGRPVAVALKWVGVLPTDPGRIDPQALTP